MIFTLKGYLATIEVEENSKPTHKRRDVPTITALAGEIELSRVQLQRIVNGQIKKLDLEIAGKILAALRRRGFDTQITDLMSYQED